MVKDMEWINVTDGMGAVVRKRKNRSRKEILGAAFGLTSLLLFAGCGSRTGEAQQTMDQVTDKTTNQTTDQAIDGSGETSRGSEEENARNQGPMAGAPDEGAVPESPQGTDTDGDVAMTDFGLRLLQLCMGDSEAFPPYASMPERISAALEDEKENVLVSPLSLVCALAMTANGASKDTLSQMEEAIGMSGEKLNAYLAAFGKELPSGEKYRLSMANSIWFTADERFTVEEEFLRINGELFGAAFFREPFDASTAGKINGWVEENTEGMIKEIVDEIPQDAVMYLVNALAFDGEWEEVYKAHQVREGEFFRADKTVRRAEMMYSTEGEYLQGDGAEGFLKYYAEGKYAFAALLPEEAMMIEEYVAGLTGKELARILANPVKVQVNAAMPKFAAEYAAMLNPVLQDMGIEDAFNEYMADFSKLGSSVKGNIFINRVLQKTYIAVDEKGTKAGAATAVEMNDEAGAIETKDSKTVYLDRPFLYMIIDCETKVPLFLGIVTDVEAD